jgi:hypothetical protein
MIVSQISYKCQCVGFGAGGTGAGATGFGCGFGADVCDILITSFRQQASGD